MITLNLVSTVIIRFLVETFATAVSARFLWGFLNGNVGVVKTYLSEVICKLLDCATVS